MIKRPVWVNRLFFSVFFDATLHISAASSWTPPLRCETGEGARPITRPSVWVGPRCKWNRWSRSVSSRLDLHPSSSVTASHPWRILLLIAVNRNTERLWSLRGLMACWVHLTLIAFFSFLRSLLSNVRGHYYCNKKNGITFSLTNGFESVQVVVFFVTMCKRLKKTEKKLYIKTVSSHGCAVTALSIKRKKNRRSIGTSCHTNDDNKVWCKLAFV